MVIITLLLSLNLNDRMGERMNEGYNNICLINIIIIGNQYFTN